MHRYRQWLAAAALFAAPALALAGKADPPAPLDARAMAARIGQRLAERWQARGVRPAPVAGDAEFLRRAYLDLTGKTPPAAEVRRFLADPSPDKRGRLIEKLLASPGYVTHLSNVYRALLLSEADADQRLAFLKGGFEAWLHQQFAANAPYDRMVRDLLTVPVAGGGSRRAFFIETMGGGEAPSPIGFFLAKQGKPENLAAASARLFLGARIECAQCHDHPFQKWTREQFWGQAAFFAGIQQQDPNNPFGGVRELSDRRELGIPGTDKVVQASFLDGTEPQWRYKVGARVTLADWITSPENPYFAKAAVNRVWAYLLGTGLVEPVDDLNPTNLPSHPELLDELARQFAANKFDLKWLLRSITLSKAYQLTSAGGTAGEDRRLFARMPVRRLTGEQLFDSFAQATGYRDPTPASQRAFAFGSARGQFIAKFTASGDKPTDFHMSIPQALAMMNNPLVQRAIDPDGTGTVAALADLPGMTTAGKVEALFLAVLSRRPTPQELDRFVKHVDSGGPKKDPKRALADVMWALLNSTEFILNH
ncbi:MAG TPA: DUF1549 and DUF1553 domain-containing protein [Gemmataceae bacterium]|nr:DUF1549 and DUF1553 domain-containing protein [Gemmataceae bacterium]